jgi:hypothetical protein
MFIASPFGVDSCVIIIHHLHKECKRGDRNYVLKRKKRYATIKMTISVKNTKEAMP